VAFFPVPYPLKQKISSKKQEMTKLRAKENKLLIIKKNGNGKEEI
jgi:hypothetical protein